MASNGAYNFDRSRNISVQRVRRGYRVYRCTVSQGFIFGAPGDWSAFTDGDDNVTVHRFASLHEAVEWLAG